MARKNNTTKRRDIRGRILRTGESQRKDGTYDYRYTDENHKRRSIYAATLEELRRKVDELNACKTLGMEDCASVEEYRKKEAELLMGHSEVSVTLNVYTHTEYAKAEAAMAKVCSFTDIQLPGKKKEQRLG